MAATNHAQAIKQDSQEYLTTALLQLLEAHQFEDITVTQVVKRAGVSRMAFYRNFDSLEQVLIDYFTPIIETHFKAVLQQQSAELKLAALSTFFIELEATLKLADKRGFEPIVRDVFTNNIQQFYQTIDPWRSLDAIRQKYYVQFMAVGVYQIWRDWLLGGQKESLSFIHQLLANLQHHMDLAVSQPISGLKKR